MKGVEHLSKEDQVEMLKNVKTKGFQEIQERLRSSISGVSCQDFSETGAETDKVELQYPK
jgi:hypothetical protein